MSNGTTTERSNGSTSLVKQQPLTLEQKQKLMKDKEIMKNLERQNPLEANKLQMTQKATVAPRNLTESLGTAPAINSHISNGGSSSSFGPNYNISVNSQSNTYAALPANTGGKPNYMLGAQSGEPMGNSLVLHPMSQQFNQQNQLAVLGSQQNQPTQNVGPSSLDSLSVLPKSNNMNTMAGSNMNMQYRHQMMTGAPGSQMVSQQFGMNNAMQQSFRPLAAPQFSPQFMANHQNNMSPQQKSIKPLSNSDLDAFLQ